MGLRGDLIRGAEFSGVAAPVVRCLMAALTAEAGSRFRRSFLLPASSRRARPDGCRSPQEVACDFELTHGALLAACRAEPAAPLCLPDDWGAIRFHVATKCRIDVSGFWP